MQERYAPKVYGKVLKVVKDSVVANKIVSEIIEEACDCFSTTPSNKDLRIFLYARAYNKGLEYNRNELKRIG